MFFPPPQAEKQKHDWRRRVFYFYPQQNRRNMIGADAFFDFPPQPNRKNMLGADLFFSLSQIAKTCLALTCLFFPSAKSQKNILAIRFKPLRLAIRFAKGPKCYPHPHAKMIIHYK